MPINPQNNALVPENSPIQPAQALVDICLLQLLDSPLANTCVLLAFQNPGTQQPMTSIDTGAILLAERLEAVFRIVGTSFFINFSGNALDQPNIDAIMSVCIEFQHDEPTAHPTLDISGGTNAAPAPTDVTTLTGGGWTVNHN